MEPSTILKCSNNNEVHCLPHEVRVVKEMIPRCGGDMKTLVDKQETWMSKTIVADKGSCMAIISKRQLPCLHLRHVVMASCNPRSDEQAENHMATLEDQLFSYINEFHDNWSEMWEWSEKLVKQQC